MKVKRDAAVVAAAERAGSVVVVADGTPKMGLKVLAGTLLDSPKVGTTPGGAGLETADTGVLLLEKARPSLLVRLPKRGLRTGVVLSAAEVVEAAGWQVDGLMSIPRTLGLESEGVFTGVCPGSDEAMVATLLVGSTAVEVAAGEGDATPRETGPLSVRGFASSVVAGVIELWSREVAGVRS